MDQESNNNERRLTTLEVKDNQKEEILQTLQVDMQEVKTLCARIKTILELQNNVTILADIENIKKKQTEMDLQFVKFTTGVKVIMTIGTVAGGVVGWMVNNLVLWMSARH